MTPPPGHRFPCEWKKEHIDENDLARQAGLFAHILGATWANYCSTEDMLSRLKTAGFCNIEVLPDSRNMFPTFVGQKQV